MANPLEPVLGKALEIRRDAHIFAIPPRPCDIPACPR
jgi:hypothetical protein